MSNSLLKITDGTTTIDLLDTNRGYLLNDWSPSIAPLKGGGVWQSSPLVDGRRLAMRKFDNAVETFDMKLRSQGGQDDAIAYLQSLTTLLEKAVAYWTSNWQGKPVWIEVRGPTETNIRYALIHGYILEGLNNPFAQPFFNECRTLVVDNFSIIIERDHWTEKAPGQETCIQTNTLQGFFNPSIETDTHWHLLATDDDIAASLEAGAAFDGTNDFVGVIPPDSVHYESGLRFPSVTIPQGAIIIDAYLEVRAKITNASDDDYDMSFIIHGEKIASSPAWGHYSDVHMLGAYSLFDEYIHRKSQNGTAAVATIVSPAGTWHTDDEVQYIRGLTTIVQEIVDQASWISGNNMAFFVGYETPQDLPLHDTDARSFYSWDAEPGNAGPILHVRYRSNNAQTAGREATCTGHTYVSNKHNLAQLSHIFYESVTAGFSANIIDSALPKELLPINMAGTHQVGDTVYFIIDSSKVNSGPFDSIILDLLDGYGDQIGGTWYYPTVTGPPITWTPLATFGNLNFAKTGENAIWWAQPSNWVTATVNGVLGWVVKFVVTHVGTTSPYQQNRRIYTANTPFLDIPSAQVPGEIMALGRITLQGIEYSNNDYYFSDWVAVGLRSKSRGENFSPYLNFSQIQNPPGVAFLPHYESPLWPVADKTAPTGYSYQHTYALVSAGWTILVGFELSSGIVGQYRGTYHAYLRCQQTGGSAGDVRLRLSHYGFGGSRPQDTVDAAPSLIGAVTLVDLGIVSFGDSSYAGAADSFVSAKIYVEFRQYTAVSIVMTYYDLILIPTDEWSGVYSTQSAEAQAHLQEKTLLDLDTILNPRASRAMLRNMSPAITDQPFPYIYTSWERQSRGGPYFQANADQRLWFLFGYYAQSFSFFRMKYLGKLYRNCRYLTMRGNA